MFLNARKTAVLLLGAATCRAQDCQPYWTGLQLKPGAQAMVSFDAGSGPAIYTDDFATGAPPYIDPPLRWDGHSFVTVGPGWLGENIDLRVLDDGTGSRLYSISIVDGPGHRKMFRWPSAGGAWESTPPNMYVNPFPLEGSSVEPKFSTATPGIDGLYGFMIDYSGPLVAYQVTRWTGTGWAILGGTGPGNALFCMGEFQTPQGPNLVVGGGFPDFAGLPARNIARWDGQQWHTMGDGPGAPRVMTTWDDGSGPSLYIGWIPDKPNPPLTRQGIARWTGKEWVSVGGGLYQAATGGGSARDMIVFDDGTGPALFVLGRFERAGGPSGIPARNIAKWDGKAWHALGAGVGGLPDHLAVADDGRGPSLFVEGPFSSVGGGTAPNIAQWVGCAGGHQCYADCDNNRQLNANDFMCFINRFSTRDPYANCDASTVAPAINGADFVCYINKFAVGCP